MHFPTAAQVLSRTYFYLPVLASPQEVAERLVLKLRPLTEWLLANWVSVQIRFPQPKNQKKQNTKVKSGQQKANQPNFQRGIFYESPYFPDHVSN
jgi:hypothetical protein